jgi:hypothetical protein
MQIQGKAERQEKQTLNFGRLSKQQLIFPFAPFAPPA